MEGEAMNLNKRKKKKSFLQKAKKFGRSGRFGKGHNIDEKTYNYFVQVLDTMNKTDFEDQESKGKLMPGLIYCIITANKTETFSQKTPGRNIDIELIFSSKGYVTL